jgi:hypothetical protein
MENVRFFTGYVRLKTTPRGPTTYFFPMRGGAEDILIAEIARDSPLVEGQPRHPRWTALQTQAQEFLQCMQTYDATGDARMCEDKRRLTQPEFLARYGRDVTWPHFDAERAVTSLEAKIDAAKAGSETYTRLTTRLVNVLVEQTAVGRCAVAYPAAHAPKKSSKRGSGK